MELHLLGHIYRCNNCEFEFCSGWSNHAAGQFVVCTECATQFILGSGSSSWGPSDGESLEYLEITDISERPTGVRSVVQIPKTNASQQWNGVIVLELDNAYCPRCLAENAIAQSFEPNASCPKCKTGDIQQHGSCIY